MEFNGGWEWPPATIARKIAVKNRSHFPKIAGLIVIENLKKQIMNIEQGTTNIEVRYSIIFNKTDRIP